MADHIFSHLFYIQGKYTAVLLNMCCTIFQTHFCPHLQITVLAIMRRKSLKFQQSCELLCRQSRARQRTLDGRFVTRFN